MATVITKTIDPVTRLEGHLKVKINVSGGAVTDALASGLLFRGFETILLNRDPLDAPTISQRICGVCHCVHRLTSILALENAAGMVPTPNAVRIRNIEQAVTFIYSHLAHIFLLAGPDYDLYGLVPGLSEGKNVDSYNQIVKTVVLPAQRLCHEIGAIFGGKTPHHMTTLPGGVTCKPTKNAIDLALAKLGELKALASAYLPQVHAFLESNRATLENFGRGYGNLIAFGAFANPADPTNPAKHLLKRGVILNGIKQALDVGKITEAVRFSWYAAGTGGYPASEPAPQPAYAKAGAYSWIKAPRYLGAACEAGPLARMAISGLYRARASVYDRLKARLLETELLVANVEKWIGQLVAGATVYKAFTTPTNASGIGLWEAPRGANGHWVRIEGSRIKKYQVIPPTNWNASPRDGAGLPGPLEKALIGTPVADPQKPLNAMKVVRSFDPCIACSVH
ncbi:MAG: periplasmic [NiFeSe] hydrogenase large subunit [Candidatus Aminicenantes bacterium]|nr:periplasmic [NiFeSe] hydrogenase large subunit [Candidatus Aminicenantes bacterium]